MNPEPIRRRKGKFPLFDPDSKFAIFGLFLGIVSFVSCAAAIILTWQNGGQAPARYALAVLFSLFIAVGGLISDILSRRDDEEEIVLFWIGIILNVIVLATGTTVMYLGTRFVL